MRSITIDPITRSKATARFTSSSTTTAASANAYFQVPGAARFRGVLPHPAGRGDCPRITTRICGVCPEAHHLASVKAADAGLRGSTPPPAARKLRELLYNGFFAGDHTTQFFALGGRTRSRPRRAQAQAHILGVVAKGRRLELGAEVDSAESARPEVRSDHGGKAHAPG